MLMFEVSIYSRLRSGDVGNLRFEGPRAVLTCTDFFKPTLLVIFQVNPLGHGAGFKTLERAR